LRFAGGKKQPSSAVKRVATKRLSVDRQSRVVYRYKQPFRDGSTHVVLEPLDFMARLAALVPRPRLNLTRFHSAGESDRTSYASRKQ
jgi:hypothetical protein